MSLADELKKLEGLHWNGTLTDEEFARAKAALLAKSDPPSASEAAPEPGVDHKLAAHLAEIRYQNELARIDREWELEKEQYMITDRNGQRHIPTPGEGIGGAIIIGVFGIFWTIMAIAITGGAPDEGPFSVAKVIFPLFGVAFTIFGVYQGIQAYGKAEAYNQALAAYQARRAAVKPEDFR